MSAVISEDVRAVFFDAVGTLLHPEPPAPDIYAATAATMGLSLSPEATMSRFLRAYQAEEDVDSLAGWVTSEEREIARWRRIVYEALDGVREPESCFQQLFEHFSRPGAWRVDPAVETLFATLTARGYHLGLGSNYDNRLQTVVDGFPVLAPLRERFVVSARVGFRKPAGEFFQEIVHVAKCSPKEILFIGDDFENDYVGARTSGLHAVLIAPRTNQPHLMHVITDLGKLME